MLSSTCSKICNIFRHTMASQQNLYLRLASIEPHRQGLNETKPSEPWTSHQSKGNKTHNHHIKRHHRKPFNPIRLRISSHIIYNKARSEQDRNFKEICQTWTSNTISRQATYQTTASVAFPSPTRAAQRRASKTKWIGYSNQSPERGPIQLEVLVPWKTVVRCTGWSKELPRRRSLRTIRSGVGSSRTTYVIIHELIVVTESATQRTPQWKYVALE